MQFLKIQNQPVSLKDFTYIQYLQNYRLIHQIIFIIYYGWIILSMLCKIIIDLTPFFNALLPVTHCAELDDWEKRHIMDIQTNLPLISNTTQDDMILLKKYKYTQAKPFLCPWNYSLYANPGFMKYNILGVINYVSAQTYEAYYEFVRIEHQYQWWQEFKLRNCPEPVYIKYLSDINADLIRAHNKCVTARALFDYLPLLCPSNKLGTDQALPDTNLTAWSYCRINQSLGILQKHYIDNQYTNRESQILPDLYFFEDKLTQGVTKYLLTFLSTPSSVDLSDTSSSDDEIFEMDDIGHTLGEAATETATQVTTHNNPIRTPTEHLDQSPRSGYQRELKMITSLSYRNLYPEPYYLDPIGEQKSGPFFEVLFGHENLEDRARLERNYRIESFQRVENKDPYYLKN